MEGLINNSENTYYDSKLVMYIEDNISKDELLEKLVSFSCENSESITDREKFMENILEREKIVSTGLGNGIAIPHARSESVNKVIMTVALLKNGIEFESPDGLPVKIAILVGAPKEESKEYLTLVSNIVRAFKDDSYRERVFSSQDLQELKINLESFIG